MYQNFDYAHFFVPFAWFYSINNHHHKKATVSKSCGETSYNSDNKHLSGITMQCCVISKCCVLLKFLSWDIFGVRNEACQENFNVLNFQCGWWIFLYFFDSLSFGKSIYYAKRYINKTRFLHFQNRQKKIIQIK